MPPAAIASVRRAISRSSRCNARRASSSGFCPCRGRCASRTPSRIAMTTAGRKTSPVSVLSTVRSTRSTGTRRPLLHTEVPRLWKGVRRATAPALPATALRARSATLLHDAPADRSPGGVIGSPGPTDPVSVSGSRSRRRDRVTDAALRKSTTAPSPPVDRRTASVLARPPRSTVSPCGCSRGTRCGD